MTPGRRLIALLKRHADGAGGFDFEAIAAGLIAEYAGGGLSLLCAPPDPESHDHQWLVTCRRDRFGLKVLDCGCGARRRVAPDGTDVDVPSAETAIGDVLFDCSQVRTE